ncbi:MAG: bifunctional UDP-N-acetylmuramoyl-tripeptide:D-alanyl-D-alanine ligase/alanine racemase [Chitinophagaceae bacterium]
MAVYTPDHIAKILGIKQKGALTNSSISYLLIDSRKLVFPSATLFFAIKSSTGDGHAFIQELYQSGVRNFVVTSLPELDRFPGATFFEVPDVIKALQQIATYHRSQFHYPIIAITGSNGKTIVKEWLNHLLHNKFSIVRSPRSFNSQLGVPLSVWGMSSENDLAIFEAGISRQGEMLALHQILQPNIGLITNIGEAHSDGFLSIADKLKEKLSLFVGLDVLVYCKDETLIDTQVGDALKNKTLKNIYTWSRTTSSANVYLYKIEHQHRSTSLYVRIGQKELSFVIPFIDDVAIENAMHCFTMASYLGVVEDVIQFMQDLPPLSMRLEMVDGQLGSRIINDSYNADLSGLLSALDFMGLQNPSWGRTVILSDVSGINKDADKVYAHLSSYLQSKNVKKLYGVGSIIQQFEKSFVKNNIDCYFFRDTDELIRSIHVSSFRDELILIKGARHFQFERIGALLENKKHRTRLEVDLSAIAQNLHYFKSSLKPSTKLMVMVKAFSYGAGSFEIANLLQYSHVDYIAVAYADEGVELRRAGIRLPIMIMNTEEESFSSLVAHNLEPELYSTAISNAFAHYLSNEGISHYPVHVKLDTGMHRLGFEETELHKFFDQPSIRQLMHVKSVFTHFVASENPSQDELTEKQLELFNRVCTSLQHQLGYDFIRHAANTSAIRRHPTAQLDMVRLGIGLYGIDPGNDVAVLNEAVALKTTIAQIRKVRQGETVGYGGKAILNRDSLIATIRIGYADGYPRALGNGKGTVMINGHLVSTVGSVCMDMTMLDITDCPEISLNDEVLVFGPGKSIVQLAKEAGTIPYEIMTGITQRVPRIYLG